MLGSTISQTQAERPVFRSASLVPRRADRRRDGRRFRTSARTKCGSSRAAQIARSCCSSASPARRIYVEAAERTIASDVSTNQARRRTVVRRLRSGAHSVGRRGRCARRPTRFFVSGCGLRIAWRFTACPARARRNLRRISSTPGSARARARRGLVGRRTAPSPR